MANNRIRGNQIKDPRTINQNEHEDNADAKRVVPVDQNGDMFGTPSNPINVTAGSAAASNPQVFNIECALANTEYSQALPSNTKKFLIKVRGGQAIMRMAFISGDLDSEYITIDPGVAHVETDISATGKTVYFQLNRPDKVVEILAWY